MLWLAAQTGIQVELLQTKKVIQLRKSLNRDALRREESYALSA